MSYFTDNPWPLVIVLAAIAVVLLVSGSAKGRTIAGCFVLAGIGLLILEEYLVSPREEVELQIEQLLTHFKARDPAAIARQISATSPGLNEHAERGLELVDISEEFHIKDIDVTIEQDGRQAIAKIRANGNLTVRNSAAGTRYAATYWKTTWQPEDGQWKLREVIQLNPTNGQEMDNLSAR